MYFRIILFSIFFLEAAYAQIAVYREPWGKDSGLQMAPPKTSPPKLSLPVTIAHSVIRFHQQVLSPVDGPRSHFRPSSSEYMKLAMARYGFLKGYFMGCDRLLRENSDEWVYRTIEHDGKILKYDPALLNKYSYEP